MNLSINDLLKLIESTFIHNITSFECQGDRNYHLELNNKLELKFNKTKCKQYFHNGNTF